MTTPAWEPIIEEPLLVSAHAALWDLLDLICERDLGVEDPMIVSDIALLFGYLALVDHSNRWQDRAIECLNLASDRISEGWVSSIWLFGGLSALGWRIQHVTRLLRDHELNTTQEEGIEEDPLEEVDQVLIRRLSSVPWSDSYDLLSGLVGIGVYFLERMPSDVAKHGLELVLDRLVELSEYSWGGSTWHTRPIHIPPEQRKFCPTGYYNLGVGHGVPGVVGLIAEFVSAGVDVTRARSVVDPTVNWLIARQRPPTALSRFSGWFVPGTEPGDSRLGWCYGDLGISAVLFRASQCVANDDLGKFAIQLLDHALKRTPENGLIRDQGLCHGALSVAHICNRMYHALPNHRYKEAANYWYEQALFLRRPDKGLAGFFTLTDKVEPCQPDMSFLTGTVGAALSLVSALYAVAPDWDRLLLLSGNQAFLPRCREKEVPTND